ncbi:MAG: gliding motility-associated ABC transporter substrate-binding protein GldG [Bacteroidota bacterium]
MKNKKNIQLLIFAIIGVIAVNWLSTLVYKRFDLTQDGRYTLSDAAKEVIDPIDSPLLIEVFLDGNLPPEFKRLKVETEQLLAEFANSNHQIEYKFIDASDDENRTAIQQQMAALGLKGAQVEIRENGKISTETVFPWAIGYFNSKTVSIPLLKNILGATSEERVNSSIQNLEYAFADGFSKLSQPKKRKVGVLKGNAEMEDRYLADFITTLREYYFIGQFTMDSVASNPQGTLKAIKGYDLLIVAQPQQAFNEAETYVLDQYTMNGGASLWMVDATTQRLDTVSGNTFVFGQDLGLNDLFFKYGLRVNPNLVKAVPSAFIVLATGNERDAQYQRYPWLYSPLSTKFNDHPIVTNIEAVKFDYVSTIDTLPNALKKTVLQSTSPYSKIMGLPAEINIDVEIPKNIKVVNEGPNPSEFNAGQIPIAVLVEGEFPSAFENRIKPFKIAKDRIKSPPNKMVVISDGDVIKNQLDRGRPLELGFDKWTNSFYGNKEFLLNTVNYLLDDSGLINIRTKEIAVPFLDPQRTTEKRTQWQILNLVLPLGLLVLFGILFQYLRKRKYARTRA